MLNYEKEKTSKNLYPKILFSFTLSITSTIIILSTILYFNFEAIVLQITNSFVKDNLAQISYSGTLMNKTAYSLLMQLNVDSDIRHLLFDYMPEGEELVLAHNRLASYISANPFVQSVYVYNGFNKTFYDSGINTWSRDDFYDREIIYILDNFQKYQILKPIPRIIRNNVFKSGDGIRTDVFTYVFYDKDLNNNDNKLEKAIVVNINANYIKDTINAMSPDKSSEIYVIDSDGILLQANTSQELLTRITDRPFVQKIIKDTKTQGSFVENEINKKSLISYTSSSVLDWKFICVTPYEVVMDQVNYVKNKVILISWILLAIGILASYLLAKRINSPINNLQEHLNTLKIEQRYSQQMQKEAFLKTLLQSEICADMDKTLEILNRYGIKINPLDSYQIILLRIDHYFDFCNRYNVSDRNLLKFAIMNISTEICEAQFKSEAHDMGDDHIIMIVNAGDSMENLQLVKNISTSIVEAVQKYLEISISVSISSISHDFCDLSEKYKEALETSQYRVYSGPNSIMMYQDIIEKHSKTLSYPIQKENKLVDALMLGNMEEVHTIFDDILETAKNYTYKSLTLILTRISTAIQIAVDNYEKNSNHPIGYDFSKFIIVFNKLEFLEDFRSHFSNLFEYIHKKLLERKDAKYDELIEKIIKIIHANYSDRNLSLESIADMVGMSPSYVGKLFKQFTSNTISGYIMQTRLEAAKKMLMSTDYSIDQITEKIGLTYSNYFYKIFKKAYGMTPNEYKSNISLQKVNMKCTGT